MHVTVDDKRRIVPPKSISPGDVLAVTIQGAGLVLLERLEKPKRKKKPSLASALKRFASIELRPDNSPVGPSRL
jgi:bifunctional DNA-binding transcriptional regulator/antitoxin component of YhaV-PrlF toxin-antitoxin module